MTSFHKKILGTNAVTFDGLSTNSLYQYAIVAAYDNLDGNGFATHVLSSKAFYTKSVVLFDNVSISQTGALFTLDWDSDWSDKTLTNLRLIKGTNNTELGTTATSVDNLLSDTSYILQAIYLNGGKKETIELRFTTIAKATPDISISSTAATQTSISYAIAETDTDNVGQIAKVELVHGTDVTEQELTATTVDNLLSNNTYTVKVTYVYNLNDGAGDHTVVKTADIITHAKATPTVQIKDIVKTSSDISLALGITDSDKVGEIQSVAIYNGNTLVESLSDFVTLNFDNLSPYTQYTLKVEYVYNLNDGVGDQTLTATQSVYTNPLLSVTSTECINTEAVSLGDKITIIAELNNPSGAIPSKVKINGTYYNVDGVSSAKDLYVNIYSQGQFAGGDTQLEIQSVVAAIGNETFEFLITANNSASCFVYGEINVVSLEIVDGDLNPIEYVFDGDSVYALLTLDNPTGYTITNVNLDNSLSGQYEWSWNATQEFNALTTEQVLIPLSNGLSAHLTGWGVYSLNEISYSYDTLSKSKACSLSAKVLWLKGDVVEITTVQQLKDMGADTNNIGYRYYKLMNDLDLSGSGSWINQGNLYGYFDGNNHTISNMRVVATYTDYDLNLGLFAYANGIVSDLDMKDIRIIVTSKTTNSTERTIKCGSIAADANILALKNVNTYGTISLTCDSENGYNNAVGGFVGRGYEIDIINCTNFSTISSNTYNVGGFIGAIINYSNNSSKSILNSINYGNVTGEYYVGGFIGSAYSDFSLVVSVLNCSNYGNVTGNSYIGGFIGSNIIMRGSPAVIINCYFQGGLYFKNSDGILIGYTASGNSNTVVQGDLNAFCDTQGIAYLFNKDNTITVFGYYGTATSVVIPETINGYTVTKIGDYAFYEYSSLISISIPSSVTVIGNGAFAGCSSLTTIEIPSSVTSIGASAFEGCSSLTSIVIPSGITKIEGYMFYGCSSLKGIVIPDSVTVIDVYSFEGCTSLISVVIPSNVTTIGGCAFRGCTNLTSVIIPSSVTTIGYFAFKECDNLTIYTEVTSKPTWWDRDWNPSDCAVVWGYKVEE